MFKKLQLFRKKILPINELFPEGFVDIHSHLLPNLDDGSKSLSESIEMIKTFRNYGIKNITTTPHILGAVWPNTRQDIESKLALVKAELLNQNIADIQLNAAAEYMLDDKFFYLLELNNLLTIKDDFILVEMSYINHPENIFEILFEIQTKGYKPILAHPERYFYYHHKFEMYKKLKERGCYFQLNLLSLVKHYGKDVYKTSIELLKNGFIDFVGSDVHNPNHLAQLANLGTRENVKLLEPILANNKLLIRK